MAVYISILRGINVSGQKIIKMDDLRGLYSGMGFTNVETYIQSGNVIFQYPLTETVVLEKNINEKIAGSLYFEVPVLVKELSELKEIIRNNPFLTEKGGNISQLYATFLSSSPSAEDISKISGNYTPDEFAVIGKTIYLFCPGGYGKAKLSNTFFEKKLKVSATTRNWKTITELAFRAEKLN